MACLSILWYVATAGYPIRRRPHGADLLGCSDQQHRTAQSIVPILSHSTLHNFAQRKCASAHVRTQECMVPGRCKTNPGDSNVARHAVVYDSSPHRRRAVRKGTHREAQIDATKRTQGSAALPMHMPCSGRAKRTRTPASAGLSASPVDRPYRPCPSRNTPKRTRENPLPSAAAQKKTASLAGRPSSHCGEQWNCSTPQTRRIPVRSMAARFFSRVAADAFMRRCPARLRRAGAAG